MSNSKVFLFVFVTALAACSEDNGKHQFVKLVYDLSDEQDSLKFSDWTQKHLRGREFKNYECTDSIRIDSVTWAKCYYKDDSYSVYGFCYGEFGGNLIFVPSQSTGKYYYMSCTCPSMVQKRSDGFYVTETIAHGTGWGSVVRFSDPRQLRQISSDSLPIPWTGYYRSINSYDTSEEKNRSQTVRVFHAGDLTLSLFFQYNHEDYLIYSGDETTYLGKVKQGEIQLLDTLVHTGSWAGEEVPGVVSDDLYHYAYSRSYGTGALHKYAAGDIYVSKDTIAIGYRYREWPRKDVKMSNYIPMPR